MNIINELWKRLLISIFLGVMFSKVLRFLSIEKVKISALLFTIIVYLVLTNIYNRSLREGNQGQ